MLHQQQCQRIQTGAPSLSAEQCHTLLTELSPQWTLHEAEKQLHRRFEFSSYYHTIAFVNAVAWIAEQQDHHPELNVGHKICEVRYTTHAANGLTLNDFICAARIEQLLV